MPNENPNALLKHWYIVSKKGKQITKSHESPHLMTTPAWHRWRLVYDASTKNVNCHFLSSQSPQHPPSLRDPLRGPRGQLSHIRILFLLPGRLGSRSRPWGFSRRNVWQANGWANVQHLLVQCLLLVKLKFFTKEVQFGFKLVLIKFL